MKKLWLILFGLGLLSFTVSKGFKLAYPSYFPKPVYDFKKNPLTQQKIDLGRVLFYDPILSKDNSISCASCHSPYNAFAHVDHDLSHGINDQIGTRNAPALINLAWQSEFMWDGAINHLDMQALAPISHPKEMDEDIANVVSKLRQIPMYRGLFFDAFADSTITGAQTLKALSQFQLTFISANAKYDSVMRKESVFTEQEANGYHLFKQHCNSCHTEPLFSTYEFTDNGLNIDSTLNDLGRVVISHNPLDSFKFKVPTLRNAAYSFPYMHDGRFAKLSQVVTHYTSLTFCNQKDKRLQQPIILTQNEKVDLVAFLLTLSDKSFVFNPNYSYPKEILARWRRD
jgi:cytochrome c peroxidase